MSVRLQTDYHKYPSAIREHLIERIRNRRFVRTMAEDLAEWLRTRPLVPDLREAPAGWHKTFSSFTICGEGEFLKTMFTIYAPGNSATWEHRSRKMGSDQGVPLIAHLQALLRPLIDPLQRLLQILQRIRHAETQVAFTEFAKRCARERSHTSLFEQRVGQRL
jgi:hypothetical protein